jgi:hypothetical protein
MQDGKDAAGPDGQGLLRVGSEERELIVGIFYDKDGTRHEYGYTAVGFAPEGVIERANARERACQRQR